MKAQKKGLKVMKVWTITVNNHVQLYNVLQAMCWPKVFKCIILFSEG